MHCRKRKAAQPSGFPEAMETVGIEPTSAIALDWRLRAYPALWSRFRLATPAGLSETSLLKKVPPLAEANRRGLSRHLIPDPSRPAGDGRNLTRLASG